MGRLTTHVLDIANGCPGAAIRIDLFRYGQHDAIVRTITNADGRCESPLLENENFIPGEYELVFHAGEYFNSKGQEDGEPRFLDRGSHPFRYQRQKPTLPRSTTSFSIRLQHLPWQLNGVRKPVPGRPKVIHDGILKKTVL